MLIAWTRDSTEHVEKIDVKADYAAVCLYKYCRSLNLSCRAFYARFLESNQIFRDEMPLAHVIHVLDSFWCSHIVASISTHPSAPDVCADVAQLSHDTSKCLQRLGLSDIRHVIVIGHVFAPRYMNAAAKTARWCLACSMPDEVWKTEPFQSIPSIDLSGGTFFVPLSKSLGIVQNFAPCSWDPH